MKNIKLLCLISLFFAASCQKSIDIEPEYSVGESLAFQNINDVEAGLAGVYAGMRSSGYYGRNLSVLPDMMSDNMKESNESIAERRRMTDWLYTSDDGTVASTWVTCYSIISDANNLLDQLARFESAENQKQANKIKGQLLAVRGLVHFDLLRMFADNYDRNSNDLGVAIMLKSGLKDPFARPARATVKASYDQIYSDLETATTLLRSVDKPINTAKDRNKIDDIGVSAILGRVSLYAKQYDLAIKYSSEVIKARPLADDFDFPFMWEDNGVEEVAWSLYFGTGEGSRLAVDCFSQGINRAQFDMSPEVVSLYGKNDGDRFKDIRFANYVTGELPDIANEPRKGRYIATKYNKKSTTTTADGIVNFKAFRTGEQVLIRAEAYALSGKDGLALADLNALRSTRIEDVTEGKESGTALLVAIATERRKELWLEGHRFFDLKRSIRTVNRQDCTAPTTACALDAKDFHWTFPIPLSEINANANMVQNKGY